MSFTNAPVTRSLVYGLVGLSIAVSLLDIKHYFYILVDLHLWQFHQTWRALIYQLCYTNSSEVLFAAMTLYNMRAVERMWGSRKFAVSAFHCLFDYMCLANSAYHIDFRLRLLRIHEHPDSHNLGPFSKAAHVGSL